MAGAELPLWLSEALAVYSERIYGTPLDPERITVTGSGMQALATSAQLLIAPGDNMVFVTPVWPNIHGLVGIMGGETRDVALDRNQGGFSLDLDRLFAASDERTRAIFLNCRTHGGPSRRDRGMSPDTSCSTRLRCQGASQMPGLRCLMQAGRFIALI